MGEEEIKNLSDRELLNRMFAKVLAIDARLAAVEDSATKIHKELLTLKLDVGTRFEDLERIVENIGDKLDVFGKEIFDLKGAQKGFERRLTSIERGS